MMSRGKCLENKDPGNRSDAVSLVPGRWVCILPEKKEH